MTLSQFRVGRNILTSQKFLQNGRTDSCPALTANYLQEVPYTAKLLTLKGLTNSTLSFKENAPLDYSCSLFTGSASNVLISTASPCVIAKYCHQLLNSIKRGSYLMAVYITMPSLNHYKKQQLLPIFQG